MADARSIADALALFDQTAFNNRITATETAMADLQTRDTVALLKSYGCPLNGVGDDAPGIQAAFNAAPRGLLLTLPPIALRLATPLILQDKPFGIRGALGPNTATLGTSILIACPDAINPRKCDGFFLQNLRMQGVGAGLTSGSFVNFGASSTTTSQSARVMIDNVRMVSGYRAMTIRNVFQAQFRALRTADFNGDAVLVINSMSDDDAASVMEFYGCGIGAAKGSNCDLILFDGKGGSAKFTDCALNFGRHGISMKGGTYGTTRNIASVTQSPDTGGFRIQTTANHGVAIGTSISLIVAGVASAVDAINDTWTATAVSANEFDLEDSEYVADTYAGGTTTEEVGGRPTFIYWTGGGMENLGGDAWHLERGSGVTVVGGYFSTDGDGNVINQYESFEGRARFNGSIMRAAGGHGLNLFHGDIQLTGCEIVNNGRVYVDVDKGTIAAITDNGAGEYRITTTQPHGYQTGDRIQFQKAGLVKGQFRIANVTATTFDLPGTVYAAGQPSGGRTFRLYMGVTNAVDNGAGGIRLIATGHKFKDGDWGYFSSIGGVPNANGDRKVKVIDANTIDLLLDTAGAVPAFSGAYTSGGYARFSRSQIFVGPKAAGITIDGGLVGSSSAGLNRARFGLLVEPGAKDIRFDVKRTADGKTGIVDLSGGQLQVGGDIITQPTSDNSDRPASTKFVRNYAQPLDADLTAIAALAGNDKLLRYGASGAPELVDGIMSGTWTPTFSAVTPGNLAVSYSTADGRYMKIGRLVVFTVTLVFTPTYDASMSGDALFSLPIMSSGQSALFKGGIHTFPNGIAFPNTSPDFAVVPLGGSNAAKMLGYKTGASPTALAANAFPSGTAQTVRFTGIYMSNS
ncbi:hypothetical protein [Sphingobium yanoikuyae]|uniref:hypothetical protein n=1 Tax=Sphingobium yanoikuyae TaxID=13690 RepID=UPI002FD99FF0